MSVAAFTSSGYRLFPDPIHQGYHRLAMTGFFTGDGTGGTVYDEWPISTYIPDNALVWVTDTHIYHNCVADLGMKIYVNPQAWEALRINDSMVNEYELRCQYDYLTKGGHTRDGGIIAADRPLFLGRYVNYSPTASDIMVQGKTNNAAKSYIFDCYCLIRFT